MLIFKILFIILAIGLIIGLIICPDRFMDMFNKKEDK